MFIPCNFLETINLREHIGYTLTEYRLVGLATAPGKYKYVYVFEKVNQYVGRYAQPRLHHMDLENNISYWPNAFNNEDCYDPSTLNAGEITLKLNISDSCQYNQYFFDTKSSAKGKLISIHFDGEQWMYTFMGADGLAKRFKVKELLIKEPFRAYADDPLFD